MDQDTMVNEELKGGWWLIRALDTHGFKIDVAFWTRQKGEEKWLLYLASPTVDEKGLGAAYRLIHAVLRDAPEWGVDPFSVIACGAGNPMAEAAAEIIKPKVAAGPFAMPNPKPYQGMTRFNGSALGGIPVDGAYIYPPWQPGVNPVE
jgi:hypothetical protein